MFMIAAKIQLIHVTCVLVSPEHHQFQFHLTFYGLIPEAGVQREDRKGSAVGWAWVAKKGHPHYCSPDTPRTDWADRRPSAGTVSWFVHSSRRPHVSDRHTHSWLDRPLIITTHTLRRLSQTSNRTVRALSSQQSPLFLPLSDEVDLHSSVVKIPSQRLKHVKTSQASFLQCSCILSLKA